MLKRHIHSGSTWEHFVCDRVFKGDGVLETLSVDLAVIGAGPAGQKGAIQGAKAGKSVAIIDRMGMLGGSCLHQGTIPSKALRMAILDLSGFLQSVYFGEEPQSKQKISMQDLQARLNKVIGDEDEVLKKQCDANGVQTIYGSARFADEHLIEVTNIDGEVTHHIVAANTLIATGSRPRHPIEIPDDDKVFMDSDEVFRMDRLPEKMIVVGCGVIGCEYATMFAALGIEVVLMDRRVGIMRMLDEEIGEIFANYIKQIGVDLRLGQAIETISHSADGQAMVKMKDGEEVTAPCLFYSMGRIANVESMCLEEAGIELDKLGSVPVNALFQTACPHIYAAGDVIGSPGLASTSMEQGRLAVRNAFLLKSHHFPEIFPFGIYTVPEISSVGPTEQELREKGIHYEVGRASYSETARGPIASDTTGMIKLIFHAETLEVLATHIIGTNATEIIPLGQMAINFRARIDYFIDQVFNYPTFAEGFRIAALNGMNKVQSSDESV